MNETLYTIMHRRSCKSYTNQPLEKAVLEQIMQAGLQAASGRNLQSPIIVAVTNRVMVKKLSQLNSRYLKTAMQDPFYNAPVVCAILTDAKVSTAIYDGSLVIGNMMLAASALGVGSCWIHRAKEVFADEEGRKILTDLGIEGHYEGVGFCVLGYPAYQNTTINPRRENRLFWIE